MFVMVNPRLIHRGKLLMNEKRENRGKIIITLFIANARNKTERRERKVQPLGRVFTSVLAPSSLRLFFQVEQSKKNTRE